MVKLTENQLINLCDLYVNRVIDSMNQDEMMTFIYQSIMESMVNMEQEMVEDEIALVYDDETLKQMIDEVNVPDPVDGDALFEQIMEEI
tara:strand:- start:2738 stop:3004 length:267 start_codon:yes stop_codon:yes gene_type:complete